LLLEIALEHKRSSNDANESIGVASIVIWSRKPEKSRCDGDIVVELDSVKRFNLCGSIPRRSAA
jgi:hypothetical protein